MGETDRAWETMGRGSQEREEFQVKAVLNRQIRSTGIAEFSRLEHGKFKMPEKGLGEDA